MEKYFTNRKLKTMKKLMMTTMLMAAIFSSNIFAQAPQQPPQSPENKGEKIEALKIAFISQQLNLTTQEAQKFWPVYNQFHGDMKTLQQNFKPDVNGQLTAEQQLDFEQKKLDLKKKYKSQFEGALGKDKVNQLYNLEKQFRDKLKELREQRQQQRGNMQGTGADRPHGGGRMGGRF